ncbi:enoyl-CoA hydratase-related protein [Streptomyces sp. NBC_01264]|uniref:enoyl-CoA hydratase-related protein n=1 Tax=Streptomyces sp. NBC_01264 TaxID=2903804 RepID=UPI00224D1F60|nr:enoyl-CoA hydratase-related protein [Streptomyces sp. NBC_01264]MCX4775914.1 enoyl-CoA hydratase-related protein [Streptomyces sp. NBC_01264]
MHVLLVASAFNSLTQRVHAELRDHGHRVAVELALPRADLAASVRLHRPDLIVAPMLTSAVPEEVWSAHTCLIVHPGPVGDRGPSSLDRALLDGVPRWGVTVLQANAEMDAGDVWASVECPGPDPGLSKSAWYRGEVADAALEAVLLAVDRFASGTYVPEPQTGGLARPLLRQEHRRIDWLRDGTERVLRTLRAADSRPGVRDELLGGVWYLHGGHPEDRLRGRPGELLATRAGAVCRATADGAVWIPELRAHRAPGRQAAPKLPAALALGDLLPGLPELPAPAESGRGAEPRTWSDIGYHEEGGAGFLSFSFPGGAMSTAHCRRLLDAYRAACARPTSVLVLGGGRDFFSNGIHLGVIEAAADPAGESWANINAMDDLVEAVLTTTDRLVISALGGNAAAGGAVLALAADEVWCRSGVVLNPHYRLMGLYGSEFWTYTLPRRTGRAGAERLTAEALPLSTVAARRLGLVDRTVDCPPGEFADRAAALAARLAAHPATTARIATKKARRELDEARRPLASYRAAELERMRQTFFDPRSPYHALRRAFVGKVRPDVTPPHLARAVPARRGAPRGVRAQPVTGPGVSDAAPDPGRC